LLSFQFIRPQRSMPSPGTPCGRLPSCDLSIFEPPLAPWALMISTGALTISIMRTVPAAPSWTSLIFLIPISLCNTHPFWWGSSPSRVSLRTPLAVTSGRVSIPSSSLVPLPPSYPSFPMSPPRLSINLSYLPREWFSHVLLHKVDFITDSNSPFYLRTNGERFWSSRNWPCVGFSCHFF